jgi:hypothetical protein
LFVLLLLVVACDGARHFFCCVSPPRHEIAPENERYSWGI